MDVKIPAWPRLKRVHAPGQYADAVSSGAVRDGKQTDSSALQKALDAFPRRKEGSRHYGGFLFLPAGTYLIDRPLIVRDGTTLAGEHVTRTALVAASGMKGPLIEAEGDNIRIDGLTIRGGTEGLRCRTGPGSVVANCRIAATGVPLRVERNAVGCVQNVVLEGGDVGAVADFAARILFIGVTLRGAQNTGLRIRGGTAMVETLTYDGPGPAIELTDGCAAGVLGLVTQGGMREAVSCSPDSTLYASAVAVGNDRLAVVDESGETASLTGPLVGLYAGQAAYLSTRLVAVPEPRDQVRVNCGGGPIGDYEEDFGYDISSNHYGFELDPLPVDFSHFEGAPGPTSLYLTERSGDNIEYRFAMQPGVYRVRLHCAEVFHGFASSGRRPFRVLVNGKETGGIVDVYATTGKLFAPIVVSAADVRPKEGHIAITLNCVPIVLDRKTRTGNDRNEPVDAVKYSRPTISAIEILPVTGDTEAK